MWLTLLDSAGVDFRDNLVSETSLLLRGKLFTSYLKKYNFYLLQGLALKGWSQVAGKSCRLWNASSSSHRADQN